MRLWRKDRGYAFFEHFVMCRNSVFRWFGIFSIPWASKWAPRRSFVHEMSEIMPENKLRRLQISEYLESDGSKHRFTIFSPPQSLLGRSGCNGLPKIWLSIGAKATWLLLTLFQGDTSTQGQILSEFGSESAAKWISAKPRQDSGFTGFSTQEG